MCAEWLKRDEARTAEGVDLALDCSGKAPARVAAVQSTRTWGTVCFVGEGGDVMEAFRNVNGSILIRIPYEIEEPAAVDSTIRDDHGVFNATQYFQGYKVRRMPVVDRDDNLVGMISIDDLLAFLSRPETAA